MVLRVEQVAFNSLTFAKTSQGEQTTTETLFLNTRAHTDDVRSDENIREHLRQYDDLVRFTVNYTPNVQTIVNGMESYSVSYRNKSWRIVDAYEHQDRQRVTFTCFYNAPSTAV